MPPTQAPQGLNMMPSNKGNGALIGSIIVILILIGIAAYLVVTKKEAPQQMNSNQTAGQVQESAINDSSDPLAASSSAAVTNADLEAIEKDLGVSNLDLGSDFKAFDAAN